MAKKSIVDIVEEKLTTFANMVKDVKSRDEMEKMLVMYLRQKEDLITQKNKDEELNNLKQKKAELAKPYNDTIRALKNMTNCIYQFGHKFENELRKEFEANLLQYAKQLIDVKVAMDDDAELHAVSEAIKDINEDYNPTIKVLEQKSEYIAIMLKERFPSND